VVAPSTANNATISDLSMQRLDAALLVADYLLLLTLCVTLTSQTEPTTPTFTPNSPTINVTNTEEAKTDLTAEYTITGSGATASATENVGAHRTTSGATVTVINTVIGWMASGDTVEFQNSFTIGSTITFSKSNITLDFGNSQLTFGASGNGFVVSSANYVAFLNGELMGADYAIVAGFGSSYVTVQNCTIHGQTGTATAGAVLITSTNSGYNQIINCVFYDENQPIFVCASSPHNTITGNTFHDSGYGGTGCGIYFDGGGSPLVAGFNEVSGCDFYDWRSNCAIAMKCSNNTIHDNNFWNFSDIVCISTFAAYPTSTANDNAFYNNTFTDCTYGLWFGGNSGYPDGQAQPVLRSLIYNNVFTNVSKPIELNNWWAGSAINDTRVYYNEFISCSKAIYVESGSSNVSNTIVAWNTFSPSISNPEIQTYTNTMVYNNTGLADYNVPESPDIEPPASPDGSVAVKLSVLTLMRNR
jgi:hypothetical protein